MSITDEQAANMKDGLYCDGEQFPYPEFAGGGSVSNVCLAMQLNRWLKPQFKDWGGSIFKVQFSVDPRYICQQQAGAPVMMGKVIPVMYFRILPDAAYKGDPVVAFKPLTASKVYGPVDQAMRAANSSNNNTKVEMTDVGKLLIKSLLITDNRNAGFGYNPAKDLINHCYMVTTHINNRGETEPVVEVSYLDLNKVLQFTYKGNTVDISSDLILNVEPLEPLNNGTFGVPQYQNIDSWLLRFTRHDVNAEAAICEQYGLANNRSGRLSFITEAFH